MTKEEEDFFNEEDSQGRTRCFICERFFSTRQGVDVCKDKACRITYKQFDWWKSYLKYNPKYSVGFSKKERWNGSSFVILSRHFSSLGNLSRRSIRLLNFIIVLLIGQIYNVSHKHPNNILPIFGLNVSKTK